MSGNVNIIIKLLVIILQLLGCYISAWREMFGRGVAKISCRVKFGQSNSGFNLSEVVRELLIRAA